MYTLTTFAPFLHPHPLWQPPIPLLALSSTASGSAWKSLLPRSISVDLPRLACCPPGPCTWLCGRQGFLVLYRMRASSSCAPPHPVSPSAAGTLRLCPRPCCCKQCCWGRGAGVSSKCTVSLGNAPRSGIAGSRGSSVSNFNCLRNGQLLKAMAVQTRQVNGLWEQRRRSPRGEDVLRYLFICLLSQRGSLGGL